MREFCRVFEEDDIHAIVVKIWNAFEILAFDFLYLSGGTLRSVPTLRRGREMIVGHLVIEKAKL
jgi:hypothetical protein